jgi:hypothetical protein
MMCLVVEIHYMCLNWVSEVEPSERTQVTGVVKDLCLRPLVYQSCAVVPCQPYSARCRAS